MPPNALKSPSIVMFPLVSKATPEELPKPSVNNFGVDVKALSSVVLSKPSYVLEIVLPVNEPYFYFYVTKIIN